ncbi:MAG: serine hydrolase [Pseudomonadota bacterium]
MPSRLSTFHWQRACVFVIAAALSACGGGTPGGSGSGPGGNVDTKIRVAPNLTDQWTLVPAADVGMDASILAGAVSIVPAESLHGLSSMLVLRHGKPVLEQYWHGYDKDTLHNLRSVTKSITSLMMGVAIDKRYIGSVNETLSSHLGTLYPNAPAFRLGVTLQDMLTMRSGLACNDWDGTSPGNENTMYQHDDWMTFYTNLEALYLPGRITRYCTGNPVALGRVIAEASKMPIPAFANEYLFGPLNITSAKWADYDKHSQTDTGGHILMRPRDMAKLGQLALQKGAWNGRQLVSESWIEESTRRHTQFSSQNRDGYGYLWWKSVEHANGASYDTYYANGSGGQYIVVVPALDLVAVFTGENYGNDAQTLPFMILDTYILASIR